MSQSTNQPVNQSTPHTVLSVDLQPGRWTRLGPDVAARLPAGAAGPVTIEVAQRQATGNGQRATGEAPQSEIQNPKSEIGFVHRYKRPQSCDEQREREVLAVAAHFSVKVRRLTVLNQARFSAIHARLADGYTTGDIGAAIEMYAVDEWHQRTGAWLDIADWMRPEKLDTWVDKVRQKRLADEKRQHARAPASPRVRGLARDLGESLRDKGEEGELLAAFEARSPDEQAEMLARAVKDLQESARLSGNAFEIRRASRREASLKNQFVRQRVLERLRAEKASQG